MTQHRTIWLITGAAILLAGAVLLIRANGCARSIAQPPDSRQPQVASEMVRLLTTDPYAASPATKAAIERVADMAAEEDAKTAEAWYALGLRALDRKQFSDAEAAFRSAIGLRPDWSWPHNALGILLANYTKDRGAEAEEAYRTAIRLDPDWSRPHNDLAIFLRLSERLQEAEEEALIAIRLDPDGVATHNNYGNLLVVQRRLPEAEEQYRKAVELDSTHPKPYYNLACVYSLQDKKADALASLEKAVALDQSLREDALRDPDLALLHGDREFKRLTETTEQAGK